MWSKIPTSVPVAPFSIDIYISSLKSPAGIVDLEKSLSKQSNRLVFPVLFSLMTKFISGVNRIGSSGTER